ADTFSRHIHAYCLDLTRKCCHGGKRASEKPTSDVRLFSYTSKIEQFCISKAFSLVKEAL
ncbi:MAG: hypothetical protein ACR2PX_11475, partial [Endozoicomonas sp.]|uniref:hypothetical protein n=1 Tax=Endozoicomonas sp. TaxID=1892382 RepID=UPI003D9BF258